MSYYFINLNNKPKTHLLSQPTSIISAGVQISEVFELRKTRYVSSHPRTTPMSLDPDSDFHENPRDHIIRTYRAITMSDENRQLFFYHLFNVSYDFHFVKLN